MKPTIRADDPLTAERTRIRNLAWRKSSRSGGASSDCVELAVDGVDLFIRDSKEDPETGTILRVSIKDLEAFKRLPSS